jgi:hypothetical protein
MASRIKLRPEFDEESVFLYKLWEDSGMEDGRLAEIIDKYGSEEYKAWCKELKAEEEQNKPPSLNDFTVIALMLAAVREGELHPPFNVAYVDERILSTTEANRDRLVIKLAENGFVDGLVIDAPSASVLWERSNPKMTRDGTRYFQSYKILRKMGRKLKEDGTAPEAIQAQLNEMF